MLFMVVLFLTANRLSADEQDCGINKVLLDPGQTAVNVSMTTNGLYLPPFPMPVTLFNNSDNMLHVSVFNDSKTCFGVSGEPNCVDDLRILPKHFAVDPPPIEIGTVRYKHTTDEDELANLDDYLCSGFMAHEAVVITYLCLAEKPDDEALTVQVIIAIVEDSDGMNRTILLIKLALFWEESEASFFEVGTEPYFKIFRMYTSDTLVLDVTYLNGWDSTPQQIPQLPERCPIPIVRCSIRSHAWYLVDDGKTLLLEFNTANNMCKFKWMARVVNNDVKWVRISIGPHNRPAKYFRIIDFNRVQGKITRRGWKCNEGCKGEVTSFDYDIEKDGTVYATLREVVPGDTYVIDSEICPYKFTYSFSASGTEVATSWEMPKEIYLANRDDMTGFCVV